MFWLIVLLWPQRAEAHVQWFVDTSSINILPYDLAEPVVWLSSVGALTVLAALAYLNRFDQAIWRRLTIKTTTAKLVSYIALGIGLIFSVIAYHHELILTYVGLVSYGVLVWKYPRLALTVLACGVGLSFTQAAFAEKLLRPDLAATFLIDHQWNFLYTLGFHWYTNRIFILQAGLVEVVLGMALALGWAPRLAILQLSIVCTITAYILGLNEVWGHMPIVMGFIIYLIDTTRYSTYSVT